MSCVKCNENPIYGSYYRCNNANVEIVGCKQHVREIMEALNKVQQQERARYRKKFGGED